MKTPNTIYFAQNIKHLRTKKKLGQKELGVLVGVSDSRISEYELGRSLPKDNNVFILLADYFEVNVGDLFGRDLSKMPRSSTTKKVGAISSKRLSRGEQIERLEEVLASLREEE